jgi:hypothetical protein
MLFHLSGRYLALLCPTGPYLLFTLKKKRDLNLENLSLVYYQIIHIHSTKKGHKTENRKIPTTVQRPTV